LGGEKPAAAASSESGSEQAAAEASSERHHEEMDISVGQGEEQPIHPAQSLSMIINSGPLSLFIQYPILLAALCAAPVLCSVLFLILVTSPYWFIWWYVSTPVMLGGAIAGEVALVMLYWSRLLSQHVYGRITYAIRRVYTITASTCTAVMQRMKSLAVQARQEYQKRQAQYHNRRQQQQSSKSSEHQYQSQQNTSRGPPKPFGHPLRTATPVSSHTDESDSSASHSSSSTSASSLSSSRRSSHSGEGQQRQESDSPERVPASPALSEEKSSSGTPAKKQTGNKKKH
jgi:hypothetical protein